jgi:hypothetical protein
LSGRSFSPVSREREDLAVADLADGIRVVSGRVGVVDWAEPRVGPPEVDSRAHGDAVEPSGDGPAAAEAGGVPRQGDERRLAGVLRRVPVRAEDPPAHAPDHHPVPPDEQFERGLVGGLGEPVEQFLIGLVGHVGVVGVHPADERGQGLGSGTAALRCGSLTVRGNNGRRPKTLREISRPAVSVPRLVPADEPEVCLVDQGHRLVSQPRFPSVRRSAARLRSSS